MISTAAPRFCAICLAIAVVAGCGPARPARIAAPVIDPTAVADGIALAGGLESMAAIAAARSGLDANGDEQVSRDELVGWLEQVRDSKVAITSVAVQVMHKGKPLSAAAVKLVPEACMGGAIKQAAGTTDDSGVAMVTIPGSEYPGVNCGLYRIEITGTGTDGKALPAKYNTDSTLGVAVGGMLPENGMVSFDLK